MSKTFFYRSLRLHLVAPMVDARHVRAERRASGVAQTTPVGNNAPRRSASLVAIATTDPTAHEQHDSSLPPSMRRDGRNATPSPTPATVSFSHDRRGPANAQAVLLMARELLRYRPANDLYDVWLDRIAQLVNAVGDAPVLSRSPHPLPSQAGNVAHGAPPPLHGADPEPRREAPQHDQPCRVPTRDEASCQVVQRP